MATTVDLTRATRDTVSTLRSAIDQAAVSSQRISTGKKVNDPFEDPAAYFTAQKLSAHAAELDRTLDQVSQGVQVVKSASGGLTSISDLIDNARAVVNQASSSSNAFDRAAFARNFNSILDQIEGIAKDSGYRGKNLLLGTGHDLKLYFGDQRSEAVTIEAADLTDTAKTLGLDRVEAGTTGVIETRLENGGSPLGPSALATDAGDQFALGNTIEVRRQSDGKLLASATIGAQTRLSDVASALTKADDGIRATIGQDGVFRLEAATGVTVTGGQTGGVFDNATVDATPSAWYTPSATDQTGETIKTATETLRLQATAFGTNLTMLQNRESFMKEFSGTLSAGSDSMVAADVNEEGANLLALQLRQQFSASAMSFANQADQGVLRLLGG